MAFHAKFFGDGSVTVKDALVPPALSATLLIALLYLWLSRLKREGDADGEAARGAGMFGALALAMMPAFLAQARCAEMDMLVALCTAVAFFAWARSSIEGSRGWLVVFYLALTVGFMTKGHVVLVLVVPPLILWSIWERLRRRSPVGQTFLSCPGCCSASNLQRRDRQECLSYRAGAGAFPILTADADAACAGLGALLRHRARVGHPVPTAERA